MTIRTPLITVLAPMLVAGALGAFAACGDDDANDRLIGAECTTAADCDDNNDDTDPLACITDFAGGYCGDASCMASTDCPDGSMCANYEGSNYCFLTCTDKADCNKHRTVDNESNCSSNVDPVEGGTAKLCIPPSSGL